MTSMALKNPASLSEWLISSICHFTLSLARLKNSWYVKGNCRCGAYVSKRRHIVRNRETVFIIRTMSPEASPPESTASVSSLFVVRSRCLKCSWTIGRNFRISNRTLQSPVFSESFSRWNTSVSRAVYSSVRLGTSHSTTRFIRALSSRSGVSWPRIMTGLFTLLVSRSRSFIPFRFCFPSPS